MKSFVSDLYPAVRRGFDRLSARPLSILVFAASVALLVQLQSGQQGRFHARGVASATSVQHPALVASYVSSVLVRVGDRVEPGAPLAELSPHFIDRELAQIRLEVKQLLKEAELARVELAVDEERWLDVGLRRQPRRPSLEGETEAVFAARLEQLHGRRKQLFEDRDHLVIRSRADGRVRFILDHGASVALGTTIATVVPERAEEIVAYVPAETDPTQILLGSEARIVNAGVSGCRESGTVRGFGASVLEAPGQLRGPLRFPLYGLPVYLSVPEGCELGVGQVVAVEFVRGSG